MLRINRCRFERDTLPGYTVHDGRYWWRQPRSRVQHFGFWLFLSFRVRYVGWAPNPANRLHVSALRDYWTSTTRPRLTHWQLHQPKRVFRGSV
jgi:hypothetical protein